VRVNLIRSIIVFQEKKYCLHDNVKLVFLKKYIQKLYTLNKKKSPEQCKWIALCTRIQNLKKHPRAASPMSRSKRELTWVPLVFLIFFILPNIMFAVIALNAEPTTQTKSLLRPLWFGLISDNYIRTTWLDLILFKLNSVVFFFFFGRIFRIGVHVCGCC